MSVENPTEVILKKIDDALGAQKTEMAALRAEIAEVKTKAMAPDYKGAINPSLLMGAPHVTTGPVGQDSRGYSILKAIAAAHGMIDESEAKEEVYYSNELEKLYRGYGHRKTTAPGYKTFLVPHSTDHIPQFEPQGRKIANELRQKQMASVAGYDPSEAAWIQKNRAKALNTYNDQAGGVLPGYPTLGELVDVQRNLEVFVGAGASEVTLPANAMIDFPKLMNGSTAFWVGEGNAITQSQQTTGNLKLVGKKLGLFVPINNDLLRYTSATTEGMVRGDMAAVAARAIDLAMLQGTGGTQPLGLINYATTAAWTYGTDKMLSYTVTGGSKKFIPQDVYNMIGLLPDIVQKDKLTFIMRNDLWAKVRGRRSDAVTANDAAGPFAFNIARTVDSHIGQQLDGYPVIASSQVANNRGVSTTNTYAILGSFKDWLIARFGVMEFLASNTSDNAMANDQTFIRAIQIMDAGARHPASFVFSDDILIG